MVTICVILRSGTKSLLQFVLFWVQDKKSVADLVEPPDWNSSMNSLPFHFEFRTLTTVTIRVVLRSGITEASQFVSFWVQDKKSVAIWVVPPDWNSSMHSLPVDSFWVQDKQNVTMSVCHFEFGNNTITIWIIWSSGNKNLVQCVACHQIGTQVCTHYHKTHFEFRTNKTSQCVCHLEFRDNKQWQFVSFWVWGQTNCCNW